jgi:ketosteroid isomerase-like protein
MSLDNVERAYLALDAFNKRDLGVLLTLMDDDVEALPRQSAVEGVYHGHDGIRRWWKNTFDAIPDFIIEVVEVRDLGDLTISTLNQRGHGSGSATPMDEAIWQVIRWRRGKSIWWSNFRTRPEALEAVGLKA